LVEPQNPNVSGTEPQSAEGCAATGDESLLVEPQNPNVSGTEPQSAEGCAATGDESLLVEPQNPNVSGLEPQSAEGCVATGDESLMVEPKNPNVSGKEPQSAEGCAATGDESLMVEPKNPNVPATEPQSFEGSADTTEVGESISRQLRPRNVRSEAEIIVVDDSVKMENTSSNLFKFSKKMSGEEKLEAVLRSKHLNRSSKCHMKIAFYTGPRTNEILYSDLAKYKNKSWMSNHVVDAFFGCWMLTTPYITLLALDALPFGRDTSVMRSTLSTSYGYCLQWVLFTIIYMIYIYLSSSMTVIGF
jgi:hypothetical protein